jgi:hypothetical protein
MRTKQHVRCSGNLVINAPIKAAFVIDEAKMTILKAQLSKSKYESTKKFSYLKKVAADIDQILGFLAL